MSNVYIREIYLGGVITQSTQVLEAGLRRFKLHQVQNSISGGLSGAFEDIECLKPEEHIPTILLDILHANSTRVLLYLHLQGIVTARRVAKIYINHAHAREVFVNFPQVTALIDARGRQRADNPFDEITW